MRAPMPSRLDLTPIVRKVIQWFALRASLTRREGGAFMLLTTADMRPSFHKSPTAKPREELTAVIAGPADEEISVKVPLPLLWYRVEVSSEKLVLNRSSLPSPS